MSVRIVIGDCREERRDAAVRFFTSWPAICRAVSELERAAPESAREGYEQAAKIHEATKGSAEKSGETA